MRKSEDINEAVRWYYFVIILEIKVQEYFMKSIIFHYKSLEDKNPP